MQTGVNLIVFNEMQTKRIGNLFTQALVACQRSKYAGDAEYGKYDEPDFHCCQQLRIIGLRDLCLPHEQGKKHQRYCHAECLPHISHGADHS